MYILGKYNKYINEKEKTIEDRISFVAFESNVIVLMLAVFYLIVFYKFSKLMFVIDILSIINTCFLFYLIEKRKIELYSKIILGQILAFSLLTVIFFGMRCGFQNYILLSLTVFFLPFYLDDEEKPRRFNMLYVSLFIVAVFYILYYFLLKADFMFAVVLPPNIEGILYIVNFGVSALSLVALSYFYSSINLIIKKNLSDRADIDQLTKLYNRYVLTKVIEDNIEMYKEVKDNRLCAAMVDIDFFKKINDKYGHNAGDYVLKKMASIFLKYAKSGIQVGRWGGEEFLFISESIEPEEFKSIMEDLRKTVSKEKFRFNKKDMKITISIGIGKYKKGMSSSMLVRCADDNLYIAKDSGRNKVVS